MLNKLIKAGTFLGSVTSLGLLIVHLVRRVQYLREDVNYQLVERVHERLANAEKQLFQEYERQKTRENIHIAITHIDAWEYFCNADGMDTKIMVSTDLLNALMIDDPEGKLAYIELRDILKECSDLIEEFEPKTNAIDRIADDIKDKIRGRSLFDNISNGFVERLDHEWYELTERGTETIMRPIYPWDSDWYDKEYAHSIVEGFTRDKCKDNKNE